MVKTYVLVQAVCEKIKAKVLKWGDRKAVQVMIITNDKLDKKVFIFWGCNQFHLYSPYPRRLPPIFWICFSVLG